MKAHHEKTNGNDRLLTEAEAQSALDIVRSSVGNIGDVRVAIQSFWYGGVRIVGNRPATTLNRRDLAITVWRRIEDFTASATCNQIDPDSLRGMVRYLEYYMLLSGRPKPLDMRLPKNRWPSVGGPVWSDATYTPDLPQERSALTAVLRKSDQAHLLTAGYLESFATNVLRYDRDKWGQEDTSWGKLTQAQFSITARSSNGTASGWAGRTSYDRLKIPLETIGQRALDKCIAATEAVRLEPGRYTTILESQASYAMFAPLVAAMQRIIPEGGGQSPFFQGADSQFSRLRTSLGMRIFDERITIAHNPADPLTGTLDTPGVEALTYIENGVLLKLANTERHEVMELADTTPDLPRDSFAVKGTNIEIDEMIRTTKRGLLVTRFSDPIIIDLQSLLMTGVTRDGLWLIEHGKITRAVRNFRFTESPMFVFNNVEQIGVAEPIWNPVMRRGMVASISQSAIASAIVPAIKIKDFSFTSTIDAV